MTRLGGKDDLLGIMKKYKFHHTNKWHINNPKSVLDNEAHKILWDFEIQTDYRILFRRPDLESQQKEREQIELRTLPFRLTIG